MQFHSDKDSGKDSFEVAGRRKLILWLVVSAFILYGPHRNIVRTLTLRIVYWLNLFVVNNRIFTGKNTTCFSLLFCQ